MEATSPGWRVRYGPILGSGIFTLLGGVEGVWLAESTLRSGVGLWRAYVAAIPIALFILAISVSVTQKSRRRTILWAFAATAAWFAAMLTVNLH